MGLNVKGRSVVFLLLRLGRWLRQMMGIPERRNNLTALHLGVQAYARSRISYCLSLCGNV